MSIINNTLLKLIFIKNVIFLLGKIAYLLNLLFHIEFLELLISSILQVLLMNNFLRKKPKFCNIFYILILSLITRESLCRNPLNDKKFHNFQRGYDKGNKIFIADENLFVCILIYFSKNINFQWITKEYKNYKINYFVKYKLY